MPRHRARCVCCGSFCRRCTMSAFLPGSWPAWACGHLGLPSCVLQAGMPVGFRIPCVGGTGGLGCVSVCSWRPGLGTQKLLHPQAAAVAGGPTALGFRAAAGPGVLAVVPPVPLPPSCPPRCTERPIPPWNPCRVGCAGHVVLGQGVPTGTGSLFQPQRASLQVREASLCLDSVPSASWAVPGQQRDDGPGGGGGISLPGTSLPFCAGWCRPAGLAGLALLGVGHQEEGVWLPWPVTWGKFAVTEWWACR